MRDRKVLAVVIKSQKVGENSIKVSLLTPNDGIIEATVFGARKTKNGLRISLYVEGNFSLYKKGDNGPYTVKDVDIIAPRVFISTQYEKSIYAAFLSELMLRLHSTESAKLYKLFVSALDNLEYYSIHKVNAIYLSHILFSEGLISDWVKCPNCGREYSDNEILGFSSKLLVATCERCSDYTSLVLPPSARRYLKRVLEIGPEEALEKLNTSDEQMERISRYLLKSVRLISPEKINSLSLIL